jgi:hypothetical protein
MRSAHQILEKVLRSLGEAEHSPSPDIEGGNLGAVKVDYSTIVLCRITDHCQLSGVIPTYDLQWVFLKNIFCKCS